MFENVKSEDKGEYTIVSLRGQFIGGDETDKLRSTLTGIAEKEQNRALVDMEKVSYLNSTALGVLISAHAKFNKSNGRIALCNISENIENIFVITKLTLVFEIFDSMEEAVKSMSQS